MSVRGLRWRTVQVMVVLSLVPAGAGLVAAGLVSMVPECLAHSSIAGSDMPFTASAFLSLDPSSPPAPIDEMRFSRKAGEIIAKAAAGETGGKPPRQAQIG